MNWYANPNIRIYLDYAHVNNNENATGRRGDLTPDYDFDMVQCRFLAAF